MNSYESGLLNPPQLKALSAVIEKGTTDPSYLSSISGSGPVEEFESAFAKATGAKYALALSSCTAALHTALMALGIGPGDEVIVSPYTWGQSVSPVLFTGATAVFADIDPSVLTLDPKSVETRITKKTKAIIPVHIFGNPADMDSLCFLAEKHGLAVVPDAAQAFGALSKSRKIGSLGDAVCFSLGIGKAVCGGEGGVLVTNNRQLYERAIALTQHPFRAFREIVDRSDLPVLDELNWNYRIHSFAAILALADLQVVNERLDRRRHILNMVNRELKSLPGIDPVSCYSSDLTSAYGVPLTYDSKKLDGFSHDLLINQLQAKSIAIQAGPVRLPLHMRPSFQNNMSSLIRVIYHYTHKKGSCPNAEFRCNQQELLLFDAYTMDKISDAVVIDKIKIFKREIMRGC
jgi:perosamine synthetase